MNKINSGCYTKFTKVVNTEHGPRTKILRIFLDIFSSYFVSKNLAAEAQQNLERVVEKRNKRDIYMDKYVSDIEKINFNNSDFVLNQEVLNGDLIDEAYLNRTDLGINCKNKIYNLTRQYGDNINVEGDIIARPNRSSLIGQEIIALCNEKGVNYDDSIDLRTFYNLFNDNIFRFLPMLFPEVYMNANGMAPTYYGDYCTNSNPLSVFFLRKEREFAQTSRVHRDRNFLSIKTENRKIIGLVFQNGLKINVNIEYSVQSILNAILENDYDGIIVSIPFDLYENVYNDLKTIYERSDNKNNEYVIEFEDNTNLEGYKNNLFFYAGCSEYVD